MVSIIPSHRGERVSDASTSVFLAPVIALLLPYFYQIGKGTLHRRTVLPSLIQSRLRVGHYIIDLHRCVKEPRFRLWAGYTF